MWSTLCIYFRCVMCICLYLCVCIDLYPQLIFFSYCLHIFQQGPSPFQSGPPFPSILSRGFSKEPSEAWLLPSPKAHFQSSFAWDPIPLGYFLTHVAKSLSSHYSLTPALEKFFLWSPKPRTLCPVLLLKQEGKRRAQPLKEWRNPRIWRELIRTKWVQDWGWVNFH